MDAEHLPRPMYVGQSQLLHYAPQILLFFAAVTFAFGSLAGAVVFGIPALVAGLVLPWRFAIYDDGIHLWFNFGKCRALVRDSVTVRANRGGVVVFPRGAQRVGYPLTDGIVDQNRLVLRDVFRFCGYDVAD